MTNRASRVPAKTLACPAYRRRALTRPARWDIVAEQYDLMIKYATAIRAGTASTEAILRRFTRANAIHPTYQAMRAAQLTDADRRGLTPLFWTHVAPYGEVKLDMSSRLQLGG
jgi:hypothetical protein